MTSPRITEWFIVRFASASGKARYVGEHALMPFAEGEARRFDTKADARAALAKVAPHHRAPNGSHSILKRKGVIAYPTFMTALGLDA